MKRKEYDRLIQVHKRLTRVIDYSYVYLRNGLDLMLELNIIKTSIEQILIEENKRRKKNDTKR